jgi:uncharacterized delta-60 repeat protein
MFRIYCFTRSAWLFAAIFFLTAHNAPAQVDPNFGTDGVSTHNTEKVPVATFALSSGKALVLANRINSSNSSTYDFVRFNSDGTVDSSYGTGGSVSLPIPFTGSSFGLAAAARQADGKIVALCNDGGNGLIVRLDENGTLDAGFGTGGVIRPDFNPNGEDTMVGIAIQPDSKIVIGGGTSGLMFLARYNTDGTPDSGFGDLGGHITYPNTSSLYAGAIQITPAGKIMVLAGGGNIGDVRRFNSDGTADPGFTIATAPFSIAGYAVLADEKFVVIKQTQTFEPLGRGNYDSVVTRYNADGTLDTGFGAGGSVIFGVARYVNDAPVTVKALPDGRMLVAGYAGIPINRTKYRDVAGSVVLLSPAGAVNGRVLIANFRGAQSPDNIVALPDGRVLLSNATWPANQLQVARLVGVPDQAYHFSGTPFDFKVGYNGVADLALFRPSTTAWWIGATGGSFGMSGDIPVAADYLGWDYDTEIAMFRPSNGTWYISANATAGPTNIWGIQWGQNGDVPAPGDYDGDEKADVAVFRPSNGAWYIKGSAEGPPVIYSWGISGDKPVPGDYDGDGKCDVAVFRPGSGTWYVTLSGGGYIFLNFGLNGDIPVQEDYDGDGKTDIAVWRPSTGVWYIYRSSDGGISGMAWGLPDDQAVPADYDGDGKTDIAIWRPSGSLWYIFQSGSNQTKVFALGLSTDIPVAARH